MSKSAFTPAVRLTYLLMVEVGFTLGEAASACGMGRSTANDETRRGRADLAAGVDSEASRFAARLDFLRHGPDPDGELTLADLLALLQAAARRGSVPAVKLLLEFEAGAWPPSGARTVDDELARRRRVSGTSR